MPYHATDQELRYAVSTKVSLLELSRDMAYKRAAPTERRGTQNQDKK